MMASRSVGLEPENLSDFQVYVTMHAQERLDERFGLRWPAYEWRDRLGRGLQRAARGPGGISIPLGRGAVGICKMDTLSMRVVTIVDRRNV